MSVSSSSSPCNYTALLHVLCLPERATTAVAVEAAAARHLAPYTFN